jgi:hypothetical protein
VRSKVAVYKTDDRRKKESVAREKIILKGTIVDGNNNTSFKIDQLLLGCGGRLFLTQ